MTAAQFWESHTFHMLFADLVKARKDAELGPIRLQVLMDWMGKQAGPQAAPARESVQAILNNKPMTVEEKREALALRQDNMPTSLERLEEVAQIIVASVNKDGYDAAGNRKVLIDKKRIFDHNYIGSYLKQKHGLMFSQITYSPIEPGEIGNMDGTRFQSVTLSK